MILHQGILALLLGSALAAALVAGAAVAGARVLRGWDPASGSAGQLSRERLTHLVTTLTTVALGFHLVSAALFLAVAEDIHPLLPGAMCATGSLNANPVGWWVLAVKGAGAALAALWLVLDRLGVEAGTFPLLRLRYASLFLLAPLVAFDGLLQARYFLGLDPAVITSCCGSLFAAEGSGVAAGLAGLPPGPTMRVFFAHAALLLAALAVALRTPAAAARAVLAALAVAFLPVALASVVSFVSVYVYELPTHHCPFDMLQPAYRFVGYPLYLGLFAGVFFAALPGLLLPLRRVPALRAPLERRTRGWLLVALVCILVFVTLALAPMTGDFSLVD